MGATTERHDGQFITPEGMSRLIDMIHINTLQKQGNSDAYVAGYIIERWFQRNPTMAMILFPLQESQELR